MGERRGAASVKGSASPLVHRRSPFDTEFTRSTEPLTTLTGTSGGLREVGSGFLCPAGTCLRGNPRLRLISSFVILGVDGAAGRLLRLERSLPAATWAAEQGKEGWRRPRIRWATKPIGRGALARLSVACSPGGRRRASGSHFAGWFAVPAAGMLHPADASRRSACCWSGSVAPGAGSHGHGDAAGGGAGGGVASQPRA